MTTIDQQFIEYIVKSLVGKPDEVKIDRRVDDLGVLLELTVDPEDLGRVIGKRGATAQSLRTLLRALGTKNDARYNLKIIDNGSPKPPRDDSAAAPVDNTTQDPAPVSDDTSAVTNDDADEIKPEAVESDGKWGSEDAETPAAKTSAADDLDLDEDDKPSELETSDKVSRTRQELSDLDDLDI
jgi:uncharacterized protein